MTGERESSVSDGVQRRTCVRACVRASATYSGAVRRGIASAARWGGGGGGPTIDRRRRRGRRENGKRDVAMCGGPSTPILPRTRVASRTVRQREAFFFRAFPPGRRPPTVARNRSARSRFVRFSPMAELHALRPFGKPRKSRYRVSAANHRIPARGHTVHTAAAFLTAVFFFAISQFLRRGFGFRPLQAAPPLSRGGRQKAVMSFNSESRAPLDPPSNQVHLRSNTECGVSLTFATIFFFRF